MMDKEKEERIKSIQKESLEKISQSELEEIHKYAAKQLNGVKFKNDYFAARNNGHPTHTDAVRYAKIERNKDMLKLIEQYKALNKSNINYKF